MLVARWPATANWGFRLAAFVISPGVPVFGGQLQEIGLPRCARAWQAPPPSAGDDGGGSAAFAGFSPFRGRWGYLHTVDAIFTAGIQRSSGRRRWKGIDSGPSSAQNAVDQGAGGFINCLIWRGGVRHHHGGRGFYSQSVKTPIRDCRLPLLIIAGQPACTACCPLVSQLFWGWILC